MTTFERPLTRRKAIATLAALGGGALGACFGPDELEPFSVAPRLSARPGVPSETGAVGVTPFTVGSANGVAYVPAELSAPAPLLLFLHGAGGIVEPFLQAFMPAADTAGVVLLFPYSFGGSWDAIGGSFGPDILGINASLHWVFDRWQVDASRIVMTGFSDGATYALAVGRANGDLFSRVVAHAPGFLIEVDKVGQPPILITHGTQDAILPIDRTSRLIVPQLRANGYDVDYRELDMGHAVPLSVANEVIASLGAQAAGERRFGHGRVE